MTPTEARDVALAQQAMAAAAQIEATSSSSSSSSSGSYGSREDGMTRLGDAVQAWANGASRRAGRARGRLARGGGGSSGPVVEEASMDPWVAWFRAKCAASVAEAARRSACPHCAGTGIARQVRTANGDLATEFCRCDAGHLLAAQEIAANQRIQADRAVTLREALHRHLEWGRRPEREDWTLASHPLNRDPRLAAWRDVYDQVVAWRNAWDGTGNLILTGNVGAGKTGLIIGLMRELLPDALASKRTLAFRVVGDLFAYLQQGFAKDAPPDDGFDSRYAALRDAWVLAIDDLGVAKRTEWNTALLFNLINDRYRNERPTWLTSNLSLRDLEAWLGRRESSRLLENGDAFHFDGPDLRDVDLRD